MNPTFIALVPKAVNSNTPDKYRPIALCNIIYKIVSKVIASRLKPLLPLIISSEQSGYVEGRQITDGIILTHEIIHSLKKVKKPGMLLKIDLSKAFDSISWVYMQKILIAFGFGPPWIRWISSLISSSFFSILINGIPSSTFSPSRSIRQGDPLSPFLFVILAEGLGRSIKDPIQVHKLKGLAFHNNPAFSHQQFVDDNMLFGDPSVQEARVFNLILKNFSKFTGALINKVKSEIFFFHTPPVTQREISRILGFTIASLPSKYLGAPLFSVATRHSSWSSLLEKLETKLLLWTHRTLNMSSPNRKWVLVKWEKACLPKKAGGIGLRDPEHSNTVLGAKIWWRWLSNPSTPWASLWTTKYAGNAPLEERIQITEVSKGSAIWNLANQQRHLIQEHSFWEVRNGNTTRFWGDSWQQLPNLKDNIQGLSNQDINPYDKISQFWEPHNGKEFRKWKEASHILDHSPENSHLKLSSELQKRKILFSEERDILRWGYEEKGTFTSQEAYKILIRERMIKDKLWNNIWNSSIWPKISTSLWLLSHNRILTWDNLRKRKFEGPSRCPNCKQDEETSLHLMQTCSFS
eukprot:PITA_15540